MFKFRVHSPVSDQHKDYAGPSPRLKKKTEQVVAIEKVIAKTGVIHEQKKASDAIVNSRYS